MNLKISIFKSVFAVVVFAGVVFFIRSITYDSHNKQTEWTGISLKCVRENVQTFKSINQRYPDSLLELNNFVNDSEDKRFYRRESKEYISNQVGCSDEHTILNGHGGWYYNKETGEVKVNVTKPLKDCFERYFYLPARNDIPSEW